MVVVVDVVSMIMISVVGVANSPRLMFLSLSWSLFCRSSCSFWLSCSCCKSAVCCCRKSASDWGFCCHWMLRFCSWSCSCWVWICTSCCWICSGNNSSLRTCGQQLLPKPIYLLELQAGQTVAYGKFESDPKGGKTAYLKNPLCPLTCARHARTVTNNSTSIVQRIQTQTGGLLTVATQGTCT